MRNFAAIELSKVFTPLQRTIPTTFTVISGTLATASILSKPDRAAATDIGDRPARAATPFVSGKPCRSQPRL